MADAKIITPRRRKMHEPTIAELKAEIKARREFEKCLCPKCAHFRAVYPICGDYSVCGNAKIRQGRSDNRQQNR